MEGEGEAERERERERQVVLGDQCMSYCLLWFFVHKDEDESRGEEASDEHEQSLGP